jgi:NADH:ubiquinone oxidoreductase subunit E
MTPDLTAIVARHHSDPSRLVQILRDVMALHGHISPPVITELADALRLPRGRVEGVVGFYAFFASEPRGRFRVLFSDNITDELAGSHALRQRMLDAFHVLPGEVSRDGLVSIGTTSCTGLCDQGPAMLVNDRAIGRLTPARIGAITSLIRGGVPRRPVARQPLRHPRPRRATRSPPRHPAGAGRGHRRRDRPRPGRHHRGGLARGPARSRRRRLRSRTEVGGVCGGPRAHALHRVQRRRGRARHVQGPRPPLGLHRPRPRGHDGRGLRGGRLPGRHLSAR